MKFEGDIKKLISEAFTALYGQSLEVENIRLEETRPDFEGDITFVCFPFLKISGKGPEQTANQIGEWLIQNSDLIASYNCVKGFLNLVIQEQEWLKLFSTHKLDKQNSSGNKVMVEYSSPNTNKPLHLGHVRNNLLGFAVSNILKANGDEVIMCNLINDRGIHICKSMLAWQKFGQGETPESAGIKGDQLVGKYYVLFDKHYKDEIKKLIEGGKSEEEAEKESILMSEAREMLRKWEANDTEVRELWQKMNAWVYAGFEETYQNMGVRFDQYYYESDTYVLGKNIIDEGLEKNIFYKKEDGSVWVDLKEDGLDEKLLLRSDGTSVYMTQDIGTAQLKFDDHNCSKSIYVVGNEQDYHFKVLFLILKKLGRQWADGMYHLSYGMVDLPSGKMKSREGTVVDADDLMREMIDSAKQKTEELGKTDGMSDDEKNSLYRMIGLGALKFFLLKVDPQKRMLFNPEESVDLQGDTGPFVQYTFARIRSMYRAAGITEMDSQIKIPPQVHGSELALIKTLLEYQDELSKAANHYSPAVMTAYSLKVAKAFNKVYAELSFLKEPNEDLRSFRLNLAGVTALTIQKCLNLLGMECPERM